MNIDVFLMMPIYYFVFLNTHRFLRSSLLNFFLRYILYKHEIVLYYRLHIDLGNLFCPLQGPNYEVEMKGSINQMDRSAKISEYLNIVKIKCQIVDESVLNVLELLCTFDICKLTCNFLLLKCSLRIIDKGTPYPA